ncbi:MAG: histidinol-phosphate transaminase [Deltaproteobacteria bacterium]|nr:histidinol-phosphate transaminase [Deltaproteobacteria bacterium]
MRLSIPDYILSIKPYVPGKPLEELEREYGIIKSIKLASNENPLGPSPKALKAIGSALEKLNRYPDGSGYHLINQIAEKHKVSPGNIVLGNGSDEIIGMLAHTLLKPGDEAIVPQPTFLIYDIMARSVGATCVNVPLDSLSIDLKEIKKRLTSKSKIIFLCNPNNPTGTIILKDEFKNFLESIPPEVLVVVDEAYIEFVREKNCAYGTDYIDTQRPLVVLRTFSKAYGLAGLRIGYGIMSAEISGLINRVRLPFNTNSLAQVGAVAALNDEKFFNKTLSLIHEGLDFMYDSLNKREIKYFPTQANFFLIDVKRDADEVYKKMLAQGVIVRSMTSYGYPNYIRVNVGLRDENTKFLKALDKVLGSLSRTDSSKRLVITIDGPAGAGKTTVSKALADRLGYKYIDTGALYRGVAYEAVSKGLSYDDDLGLKSMCTDLKLQFVFIKKELRLISNDSDITDLIRTPEITMFASAVSARPIVREFLLTLQRKMGRERGVVFEGRDMGTVVFPDADIKFYLDASHQTRALRRYREIETKTSQSLQEVENDMKQRDENDSTRKLAPLKPAEDAEIIDSTDISADEVVELMLSYIKGGKR